MSEGLGFFLAPSVIDILIFELKNKEETYNLDHTKANEHIPKSFVTPLPDHEKMDEELCNGSTCKKYEYKWVECSPIFLSDYSSSLCGHDPVEGSSKEIAQIHYHNVDVLVLDEKTTDTNN